MRVFDYTRTEWEFATSTTDWEKATGKEEPAWMSAAVMPLAAVADTLMLPIAVPMTILRRQQEAKAESYLVGDDTAIRNALGVQWTPFFGPRNGIG